MSDEATHPPYCAGGRCPDAISDSTVNQATTARARFLQRVEDLANPVASFADVAAAPTLAAALGGLMR